MDFKASVYAFSSTVCNFQPKEVNQLTFILYGRN